MKYFSFLLVFGLLLTACGKGGGDAQNSALIGSWQSTDKTLAIKFATDGKYVGVQNSVKSSGTYKVDGGKMTIVPADNKDSGTPVSYDVNATALTFTSEDKKSTLVLNKITDDAFAALLPK